MGKLGKKARKFAKKNLQSVLKRKRKLKSVFKKKAAKKDELRESEDPEGDAKQLSNGRKPEVEDIKDISLDAIFDEDDSDVAEDDLDSDGYLSEEESCSHLHDMESESNLEDNTGYSALSVEDREIHSELVKKMKKLDRLKDKDPDFLKFFESNRDRLKVLRDEEDFSDEDESSDDGREPKNKNGTIEISMLLNSSAVDSLCQLVSEQHNVPALIRLLNGFRAACHYGTESSNALKDYLTFSKILMFMLREADSVFHKILGISCTNERKEAVLELKNTSKWKNLKPLIKTYLRSTLFFLNEVSDSEILAFTLSRLRASMIFFAAFPSLLQRLIKASIHLWATGEETLSLHSFLVIRDVAAVFNSDCFDTCLVKSYKAFIGRCKFVEPVLFKRIQFLKNSFVELCSLDVQKSFTKAIVSIQHLAKILQLGLRTKKKEALKKICSWQYANCVELWVAFLSANIRYFDLQALLYMIIQIINGVAVLFPGPRYLPLRVKCVQWLNHLSSSSGVFIPVASLTMDVLEYKIDKGGRKPGKEFNFTSTIKLPKHWLKSRNFQEECVLSAIELLAVHFAQWSYHISFPELATIPLIRLRKFHEITTTESFRNILKRFIDQVEQNIEFVRKKRDEVAFSPRDQQSVESFLQLEKPSGNMPFTQYYRSLVEKSASRNLLSHKNMSYLEQKQSKRKRQLPNNNVDVAVNGKKIQVK
ncbi:nucleolar complex protein 2 homolog isoform X2 [Jatropha curcas]|uniref:nucleolar complex protein 2 homolog isoform X2 n=1 Tax=Jatropha curcas TaxID=180498 RepID=UPI0005FB24E6|nr:nucleolar complex protein 2 homolog isoform X2 [Jatropha curcas]